MGWGKNRAFEEEGERGRGKRGRGKRGRGKRGRRKRRRGKRKRGRGKREGNGEKEKGKGEGGKGKRREYELCELNLVRCGTSQRVYFVDYFKSEKKKTGVTDSTYRQVLRRYKEKDSTETEKDMISKMKERKI